jgi:telomere length regulation protein
MIIGTGISGLIEEPDKALKFDIEEMRGEEADWYLNLTKVEDEVGSSESIRTLQRALPTKPEPIRSKPLPKSKPVQHHGTSKIVAIEEIEDTDEEEDEDDDLMPYEKPGDDPYDSDEDPTLIQRNKPIAPV